MEAEDHLDPPADGYQYDDAEDGETDADYRERMMHMDTFLRLNRTYGALEEMGKQSPEYALEVEKALRSSFGGVSGGAARPETNPSQTTDETVRVKTHAHLIYHGDLLQLSRETVCLTVSKRDMTRFTRIVNCFKRMLLGRHTDEEVAEMRRDYVHLFAARDVATDGATDGSAVVGGEIKTALHSMMATPLYFTNSCMALIACGQMLRQLYRENESAGPVETYDQLMRFVRKHMRHNAQDPFECDCGGEGGGGDGVRCSEDCKTLMSMIMEVPPIVHNQSYPLQILAYLMFEKSGREGCIVFNLKNACSPGLLDRIPARVAMLLGTLDETEIRRRLKAIRKQMQHLNPLKSRAVYSKASLESLVGLVQDPRVQALIDVLPGSKAAAVELRLPKCESGGEKCLNKGFDEKRVMTLESNNNGKRKCCGYLRLDPFDLFLASVSLAQLAVYAFTDPLTAPSASRRHFFVRDIIVSMAARTVKMDSDKMGEMFCHLDRTRVFRSFNDHPFLANAFQETIKSYIDYVTDAVEKAKAAGRTRRARRYLNKIGVPEGTV